MTDDDVTVDPMLNELRGVREDLRDVGKAIVDERKGRKGTNRLGIGVIVVFLLAAGSYVYRTDADREQRAREDCTSKVERARLVREGIVAAADEVALYAGVDADQRVVLRKRVAARVVETVPPPDC